MTWQLTSFLGFIAGWVMCWALTQARQADTFEALADSRDAYIALSQHTLLKQRAASAWKRVARKYWAQVIQQRRGAITIDAGGWRWTGPWRYVVVRVPRRSMDSSPQSDFAIALKYYKPADSIRPAAPTPTRGSRVVS